MQTGPVSIRIVRGDCVEESSEEASVENSETVAEVLSPPAQTGSHGGFRYRPQGVVRGGVVARPIRGQMGQLKAFAGRTLEIHEGVTQPEQHFFRDVLRIANRVATDLAREHGTRKVVPLEPAEPL